MAVQHPEPHGLPRRAVPSVGHWRRECLSQAERISLAVEIVTAHVRARRALRRTPIAAVVASMRSDSAPATPNSADTMREALRLGHAVMRTLTLVPGDTRCLVRSLVLTRLLARRGISAKLVIGARGGPDFLAHAWVEYHDHPVLPPGDGSFGRLVEL